MTAATSPVPPKKRPLPDHFQAAAAPDAKKPNTNNSAMSKQDLRIILNKVDNQFAIRSESKSADEMRQERSRTISSGEDNSNFKDSIFGGARSAFAPPVIPPINAPLNGRVEQLESQLNQITQNQTKTNALLENLLAQGHQPQIMLTIPATEPGTYSQNASQPAFSSTTENFKPQDPFEIGKRIFEQNNYRLAIPLLLRVSQGHPEFGHAKYLLGKCYLEEQNPLEAVECFSLVPPSSISFYQEAQYELGQYCYQQKKWFETALHWKNVSTLHPKFDSVQKSLGFCHFNLGVSHWEKKDFACANKCYELVPPSHQLFNMAQEYIGLNHFAIGDDFYERQNFPDALHHYRKVPAGHPAFEGAQYKIGKYYYETKDFVRAVEPLRKVSKKNSKFSDAQFSLGNCCWRTGDFRDALKYYLNVSHFDPKLSRAAQCNIGICYYHLNKFDKAIEHLIPLKQNENGSDEANHYLGLCYLGIYNEGKRFAQQGYYCKALDCLNQLPQDYYPEAVEHKRGLCFYGLGNYPEAITHLKKVPRNAEIEQLIKKCGGLLQ